MKLVRLDSDMFPATAEEIEGYRGLGLDVAETDVKAPKDIAEACREADFVVVTSDYLRRDVIDMMKRCKAIIRKGTGCDKIDVDYATERGIIVTNLPGFAFEDVADHAMMLVLALARRLPWLENAMAERDWVGERNRNIDKCIRLEGKTMGIVGLGNIGKAIAKRALAFDMRVLTYHRNPAPDEEEKYGAKPVHLDQLIRESDVVVIACPLTDETRGMLSRERIAAMKPTALLVNVGRGGVCDERALADALAEHKIAGAGIDVYEHVSVHQPSDTQGECYFVGLDNVILTPHTAAGSLETTREGTEKTLEQVGMLVRGVFPSSVVNPEVYEKVKQSFILAENSAKPPVEQT